MTAPIVTEEHCERAMQLHALLHVCERAIYSLNDVGDGQYRDSIVDRLSTVMELAAGMAYQQVELLDALEMAGRKK